MTSIESGLQASGVAIGCNILLAVFKVTVGIVGNSYALVADGIESTADVMSSLIVWSGLRISVRPPDRCHPYGHGKAESIAGIVVSLAILGAAVLIAWQSIGQIRHPSPLPPAGYTLIALVVVILVKEGLYRYVFAAGDTLDSTALKSDAWHHRSDALTSMAAFIGISISLIGGAGYEMADDWAALIACAIIFYNGIRLLQPALNEVMDGAVSEEIRKDVKKLAGNVEYVVAVGKCRIRKSGLGLFVDIHIVVDGQHSVEYGHQIAHDVQDCLCDSHLKIHDVVVHIEPARK